MGVGAVVGVGLGVASALSKNKAAKNQAKATAAQAAVEMQNRAREIKQLAATQRVSFLNAGLDLEGTPQVVIDDTYNTGMEDIEAIRSAANKQIKAQRASARADLLGSIAGLGASIYGKSLLNSAGSGITESGGGFVSGSINGVYQGGYGWNS